jgi:hypothetical protein
VIKVEKSTVIDRSSDDVFAYVADQANAVQWQSGIVEIRRLTDGPPGVGTKHAIVRTLMGKQMAVENEYVAYEPGRLVTFRATSGPALLASYTVESTAAGTRLTCIIELNVTGFLSLAEPLVAAGLRRDVDANFARLKGILDAPGLALASDTATAEEM